MVKIRDDLALSQKSASLLQGRLRQTEYPLAYEAAMEQMLLDVDDVANGAQDLFWFLEHQSVLTAGTSAKTQDLIDSDRFRVVQTGRGGQYTYHGPGQRIVYCITNLKNRENDVRLHVAKLEQVIINALESFGLRAFRREDRVGVWVPRPDKPKLADGQIREDKIAALGIRVSRGIAFHGFSINHEPELSHFDAIVPCGVEGHGVTSLINLGYPISINDLDIALQGAIEDQFGPLVPE